MERNALVALISSFAGKLIGEHAQKKQGSEFSSVHGGWSWQNITYGVSLTLFSLLVFLYLFRPDSLDATLDWVDRAVFGTVTSELNLTAIPKTVTQGESVTLTWSATLTGSPWSPPAFSHCIASSDAGSESEWTGPREVSGSEIVTPKKVPVSSYKLECWEDEYSGSGTTVRVNVLPDS